MSSILLLVLVSFLGLIATIGFAHLWLKTKKQTEMLKKRLAPFRNRQAAIRKLNGLITQKKKDIEQLRHAEITKRKAAIQSLDKTIAERKKAIEHLRHAEIEKREARIEELETEISEKKKDIEELRYVETTRKREAVAELDSLLSSKRESLEQTREDYLKAQRNLSLLKKEVAVYDERLAFAELGMYEPHFDFGDSEKYKAQIKKVRDQQKRMASDKRATHFPKSWKVNGSDAEGKKMVDRQVRLTLRAFNNECEAAIGNVRWNNVNAMEKRILTAAKAIDKENQSMQIAISEQYIRLKIDELFLKHEHEEQAKLEKEERAEMARAEREEKKLEAEAAAAEREEEKLKALLEKARKEASAKSEGITDAMAAKIAELEASLAEANAKTERTRSMAEMTKSGFVYVISNVGSFGEDVVKIGLTRRANPDDRVKELGDASVPFPFDTHAMIYSDEAPALEAALHREFAERRVNLQNMRKEFFRVGLPEVEKAVSRLAPEATFFTDREAQEWHETLARRNQQVAQQQG